MSDFYKIEGENDSAFFRANFNQIRGHLMSDSSWATSVVEIENKTIASLMKFSVTNALASTNVVEQGEDYFVVRGAQGFFYRIEAVSEQVSRITPEGRIWGYLKFAIPFGLFMSCVLPVVLTPLIFSLRRKGALNQSKHYLKALCQYLEMRQQSVG